jgi:outer membrane receptor for ferrienterochelin and colicins
MNNLFLILFLNFIFSYGYAQEDTLKPQELEEVVTTATRTEKLLSTINLPVTLITQAQIQQMGSLRLNEVLQEQTGLAISTDHGQGIQMQGLNPEYTLILIDGEPLIGRTAGTLELSRLAVGNIKQIEIIKGASSSLYGSEALGGVINIITENSEHTKYSFSTRYGTNQTADIGLQLAVKKEKWQGSLFFNRYSSKGYDFTPNTFGQTVEPFNNYTGQIKLGYKLSEKFKVTFSGRYFIENQKNNFEIGTFQNLQKVSGQGRIRDTNFNPIFHWQIFKKLKAQFRFYNSIYQANSQLNYLQNGELFDTSFFRQVFSRPELQIEYFLSEKHIFTFGLGNIWESVGANRYTEKKHFQNRYVFLQYEFLPTQKWNITLGGRFDGHTIYGSQLSPKLAIQYEFSPKFIVSTSVGRGFKAPDFRQLYLNFTNTIAGYSVYGSEELPFIFNQLQEQNQIAEILLPIAEIGNLQAESSISYNIGFKIKPIKKVNWNINFFRNDIDNLIETQTVARIVNGQNIFSYRNLRSIFTQGIETDLVYNITQNIIISAGYQILIAKDKEIVQKIDNGEIFKRNPQTLITTRVQQDEYGGLFGRSKNMFNFKIFYQNQKKDFSANMRAIYRGKYGIGDRNGNLILDDDSEYVNGFWTFNISITKEFFKKKFRTQAGVDNLANFRDELNMPNIAGRLLWISLQFNFIKK